MALELRHPQTPIADLPTDQRASAFPKKLEKGLYQRRPMILKQRLYRQTVKDQGEDVHGAHLRPALKGQLPSKPGNHLRFYLSPTNFPPAGGRARTTPQGYRRDRHSSGRALAEERCPNRHPTASLRYCQS